MSYVTVEVAIDHGRIVAREPGKLPEKAEGLLTILSPAPAPASNAAKPIRKRVELPIIKCKPGTVINPTPEELDASFWGD